MARVSDHEMRDAEHQLRCAISLEVQRYVRRMYEKGRACIIQAADDVNRNGGLVDGVKIGKAVGEQIVREYFNSDTISEAIEAPTTTGALGTGVTHAPDYEAQSTALIRTKRSR
jgi:hypothetical protein